MSERSVQIVDEEEEIVVYPIEYIYSSIREVRQFEFELKGAVSSYLKNGFKTPRLWFEERIERGRFVIYCIIESGGVRPNSDLLGTSF